MKRVTLLGPKHVGKSTVGKELAELVKFPFFDSDKSILTELQKQGRFYTGIARAFEDLGGKRFQNCEAEVIQNIINTEKTFILAAGGGVADNARAFSAIQGTYMVFLQDDGEKIWNRVRAIEIPAFVSVAVQSQYGAALTEKEKEEKCHQYFLSTFNSRNAYYAEMADAIVEIFEKTPEQIATEICAIIGTTNA